MLPRSALARIARRAHPASRLAPTRPVLTHLLRRQAPMSFVTRAYSDTGADASKRAEGDKVAEQVAEDAASSKETEDVFEAQIRKKDEEIVDLMSRLRYAQADYQNLQRIAQREKQHAQTYAISNLARSLLTTLDNLSMALAAIDPSVLNPDPSKSQTPSQSPSSSSPPSPSSSSTSGKPAKDFFTPSTHNTLRQLHEGVQLTHASLLSTLRGHGVEPFNAKGESFDPNLHEAVFEVPVGEGMEGKVVEVMKGGYKIGDRVLRAAQVGVGKKQ